eukprot:TRINITY_DN34636_c0_g1_i1.p1 TRINITY_DN34636_c0_g1~~TRINITY_DN34636_c0_g1_i1.p1  ORF type:complete len:362 (-),score=50.18 TRINITY_DN34636_c0_g1_i1:291-1298(-)
MGCGCSYASKVAPVEVVHDSRFVGVIDLSSDCNRTCKKFKKYCLGEVLGNGSFGKVHKACLKADPTQLRAVKKIPLDSAAEGTEFVEDRVEVKLLELIWHANIAKLYEYFQDTDFAYIVLELCCGGDLGQWLQQHVRCNEQDVVSVVRQMAMSLDHIHGMNIVHRDIKAANFVLAESSMTSTVKLVDFGLATRFAKGEYVTGVCGSAHYLAPEVLMHEKYRCEVDLWALGVLMYLLLYGLHPHDGDAVEDIALKIVAKPIRWQTTATVSFDCLHFLQQLLERNPCQRSSAKQALEHPWIAGIVPSQAERRSTGTGPTHRLIDSSNNQRKNKQAVR